MERAAALAAVGPTSGKDPKGKELAKPAGSKLPVKRGRKGLTAKEVQRLAAAADEAAEMLAPLPEATEEPKKKKKKKVKVAVAASKGDAVATSAVPDAPAPIEADVPEAVPTTIDLDPPEPSGILVQESAPLPGSPPRPIEGEAPLVRDRIAAEVPASGASRGAEMESAGAAADVGDEAAQSGPTPLTAGGPSSSRGGADEAVPASARPVIGLPFCHLYSEMGRPRWEERRAQLIGQLDEWFAPVDEPSEADRFVPNSSLRKDDSVLLSGRAQIAAFDQFHLPRDIEMLAQTPSGGLRRSLLSYCLRGALIGEELHDRIGQALQASTQLAVELAKEKKAREVLEKKASALEAEKASADARRAREMDKKQLVITNLETHKSKQAFVIAKLREEIAGLKSDADRSSAVIAQQEERIKLLEESVETETLARQTASAEALSTQRALEGLKAELEDMRTGMAREVQARQEAQAELLSTRRTLEGVQVELEEVRAARDLALADVKSIEARLGYMTSEEGKKEVINEYRRGPVGKAEVSLAVKAGFDFLKTRLPSPVLESVTVSYPSRVRDCVELLEDLEARGGGVPLSSDEEEDEEEESSDEDGEDDEGGDPK